MAEFACPGMSYNKTVWKAISSLSKQRSSNDPAAIDAILDKCEKKLVSLGVSEMSAELRIYALAMYCKRAYPKKFPKSNAYVRFGEALTIQRFELIARKLIEKSSPILIVYYMVLRFCYASIMSCDAYEALERDLMLKALEIGMGKK